MERGAARLGGRRRRRPRPARPRCGAASTPHTYSAPRFRHLPSGPARRHALPCRTVDEALATLDEADGLVQANEERFWESELLRVRGEVAPRAAISNVPPSIWPARPRSLNVRVRGRWSCVARPRGLRSCASYSATGRRTVDGRACREMVKPSLHIGTAHQFPNFAPYLPKAEQRG